MNKKEIEPPKNFEYYFRSKEGRANKNCGGCNGTGVVLWCGLEYKRCECVPKDLIIDRGYGGIQKK